MEVRNSGHSWGVTETPTQKHDLTVYANSIKIPTENLKFVDSNS